MNKLTKTILLSGLLLITSCSSNRPFFYSNVVGFSKCFPNPERAEQDSINFKDNILSNINQLSVHNASIIDNKAQLLVHNSSIIDNKQH